FDGLASLGEREVAVGRDGQLGCAGSEHGLGSVASFAGSAYVLECLCSHLVARQRRIGLCLALCCVLRGALAGSQRLEVVLLPCVRLSLSGTCAAFRRLSILLGSLLDRVIRLVELFVELSQLLAAWLEGDDELADALVEVVDLLAESVAPVQVG